MMNWINEFYLMNKDQRVLTFRMEKNEFDEVTFKEVKEEKGKDFIETPRPIGFKDIQLWLAGRQAPKHRAHIAELLRQCGCYNLDGYLRVTHALTLNDTFWVKPADSTLKWDHVSLYSNEFDETIARIAFEGGMYGKQFSSTSPEFGTDGAYAKCWIRKGSDILLLKQGSDGARNTGLEPYSEYYSSQISKQICEEYVEYDMEMYRGKLVSSCRLFTNEKVGFTATDRIVEKDIGVSGLLSYFTSIGSEDAFRRMLVFDALTINTDRHLGNFGVLVDNDTQKILKMAPVFDNNQSLLPYAEEQEFRDIDEYLKTRPTRIGIDFNQVAHQMLSPEIRADLNNLKGFSFQKHPRYNLPEERLKILEELIDKQIYNILHDIRLYVPVEFPEVQPPFQNTNVDANNNEKKDIKTADIEIEK